MTQEKTTQKKRSSHRKRSPKESSKNNSINARHCDIQGDNPKAEGKEGHGFLHSPLNVLIMMSFSLVIILASLVLCIANNDNHLSAADIVRRGKDVANEQVPPFVLAGYLPEYRSYINVNATSRHLTDVLLFSLTPETFMQTSRPGCCLSDEHYDLLRKARSYKREQRQQRQQGTALTPSVENMNIIVTIGGGGRSNGFSNILSSQRDSNLFLRKLVQFCKKERMDGIDMNHESIKSMEEYKQYLSFLIHASKTLHRHDLLLTMALHPNQFLPREVCQYVDRVHVMTYDMMPHNNNISDDNDGDRNHHARMDRTKEAISSFLHNDACPAHKIILGIPAYARHERSMGMVKTYSEIVDDIVTTIKDDMEEQEQHGKSNRETRHFGEYEDIKKQLYSIQSWNGYQFDSPRNVQQKVIYAKEHSLGGVFFWELGQDKQMETSDEGIGVGSNGGILLEAAAQVVYHNDMNDDDDDSNGMRDDNDNNDLENNNGAKNAGEEENTNFIIKESNRGEEL